MTAAQQLVDDLLARAVAEFDGNPLCSLLMRRLSYEVPNQFCHAAMEYLESDEHSGALRFLSILMLRQPSIFEQLMNPLYGSKQRAVHLFRRLLAVDPSFDLKLARRLPDKPEAYFSGSHENRHAARAIEILDEASCERRLLPILGCFVNSEDTHVAARATLFVGRRLQNPEWVARQLKRKDARVRANAVESIWGLRLPRAKALLEECLTDPAGRVRGNSLLGLHLIGESGVIPQVGRLASRSDYGFRSSAAWTMGRIGDPYFVPGLTDLIRDENPQVRGAALRSLIEIRRIESKTAQAIAARAEEAAGSSPEVVAAAIPEIEIHLDGGSYAMGDRRQSRRGYPHE